MALIHNQRDIPKNQLGYGLRSSAATGCGWIATYHALRLMGYRAVPEKLIRYFNNAVLSDLRYRCIVASVGKVYLERVGQI